MACAQIQSRTVRGVYSVSTLTQSLTPRLVDTVHRPKIVSKYDVDPERQAVVARSCPLPTPEFLQPKLESCHRLSRGVNAKMTNPRYLKRKI